MTMTLDGSAGMTAPSGAIYNGLQMATAQATTSGTSIDFAPSTTTIPSWAKRVTVIFNEVSTNGTSAVIVQLGSATVQTSGYSASAWTGGSGNSGVSYTSGFGFDSGNQTSAYTRSGTLVLTNVSGNTWVASGAIAWTNTTPVNAIGGSVTLSGTLDRLRVTTAGGANTFDAGSVNIMWE